LKIGDTMFWDLAEIGGEKGGRKVPMNLVGE